MEAALVVLFLVFFYQDEIRDFFKDIHRIADHFDPEGKTNEEKDDDGEMDVP